MCGFCNVWVMQCVDVCMCWFCNVWVCVCMGFVICDTFVGFVMFGRSYVWFLQCVCVCVYVRVL